MARLATVVAFRLLAVLAAVLLWGPLIPNGITALLTAAWCGRLDHQTPLRTVYTGFVPVDFLVAVLVAFFYRSTSGEHQAYGLFVLDAYCALNPAYVWLYAEAARPAPVLADKKKKPWVVARPVIITLLWTCFGGGIALPTYFAAHILWTSRTSSPARRVTDPNAGFALCFALVLGGVVPPILAYMPVLQGRSTRSVDTQQLMVALLQSCAILVEVHHWALSRLSPLPRRSLAGSGGEDSGGGGGGRVKVDVGGRHPSNQDGGETQLAARNKTSVPVSAWIRLAYLLAGVISGVGHAYVLGRLVWDSTDMAGTYLPLHPLSGPVGIEDSLTRGPWLFLQYDLLCYASSSLVWAFLLLRSAGYARGLVLAGCMAIGAVVLGPGATVSLALWVREGMLD